MNKCIKHTLIVGIFTCLLLSALFYYFSVLPRNPKQFRIEDNAFDRLIQSESQWIAFQHKMDLPSSTVNQAKLKWPMQPHQIPKDPNTGLCDFRLEPYLNVQSNSINDTDLYHETLIALNDGELDNGSKLRSLHALDRKYNVYSSVPNYDIYPQMVDLRALVRSIKNGEGIDTTPINDPSLRIIKFPRNVCSPNQPSQTYDLIVIIKSCVHCFEKRSHIRSTFANQRYWSNFRVRFVFVIGYHSARMNGVFKFDEFTITLSKIPEAFQNKSWDAMKAVSVESQMYGDMLIGAFDDTYYNLTLKQMLMFRWIHAFCRDQSKLFLFIDDDMSIIPNNMIPFCRKIPYRYQSKFIGGPPRFSPKVFRPNGKQPISRWSVSSAEIPWDQYPPYYFGMAYFLGIDVIEELAIASAFTKYLRIDDVYLGILLYRLRKNSLRVKELQYISSKSTITRQSLAMSRAVADQVFDWASGKWKEF